MAALLTIITSFIVSFGTVVLREKFSSKRDTKARVEAKKNRLLSKLEVLADSLSQLPSTLEELHIARIETMGNGVPSQERLNAIEAKCNGLVVLYFDKDLEKSWNELAKKCNLACNKSIEFMIANLKLIQCKQPPLQPGSCESDAFNAARKEFLLAFKSMLREMPNVRRRIEAVQR
ncbi:MULTISPECIES: hypothetical protein [Metallibacterium]|uniref:hypothetical protein n=1 Tax=Metallibacterium TaxID=1218803 RepID=UPI002608F177|nr:MULTISPECIES: hypothetical protein [Metallibacterium]MBW8075287.1 hypothetical protein [Metallibacterium scheffleri]